jgi:type IV secretory pathway VirB9-like protein
VISALLLLAPTLALKSVPKPPQPDVPRTVSVAESERPPAIFTELLQSTLIVLPAEEKVATVFGGDTVDWSFDAGHVASRFLSVKPKTAGVSTDLHIVSDHGNEYTVSLREVSKEQQHFDSKVFLSPGDKASKERLGGMPVFVPAAELDKVKAEATAAKASEEAAVKSKRRPRSTS